MKLGEMLLKKGLITDRQLDEALKIQVRDRSLLGKILVSENYINKLHLQKTLAEKLGLPFADLTQIQINTSLVDSTKKVDYFNLELIPVSYFEGVFTIAVTDLNEQVKDWVQRNYAGNAVDFVITTSFDILWTLQRSFAANDDENARFALVKNTPWYSASNLFGKKSGLVISLVISQIITLMLLMPSVSLVAIGLLLNISCFAIVTYKTIIFSIGKIRSKNKSISKGKFADIHDNRLPVYSVLVPLFREDKSVKRLINALKEIDYPKSLLDIKLVVEADDEITINAIKAVNPPQYMEIIRVPYSLPRTKPKACNYALNYIRGDYVTIYDAEDAPDTLQLRKALATFRMSDSNVACVQAKLNYYNAECNIITRWFALEYATWFEVIIKGLEKINSPIPLGGTSNHIKTSILQEIGGWDAFNVTEDADLGIRLAQHNYRTATINSSTMEEAPASVWPWIKQRTRWLKGFIQTYFVHMREPRKLIAKTGLKGFVTLQFFIGIPAMIYFLTPIWLVASLFNQIPEFLLAFAAFNFVYASAVHIIMSYFAQWKLQGNNEAKVFHRTPLLAILTIPAYGLLNIIASWRAIYQLIFRPYYWDKTEHGIAI